MTSPAPLRARTVPALTLAALALAKAGDHRARAVEIGQRHGIITPHCTASGQLDADDLAAQIWALAHDEPSDTGDYTAGVFVCGGVGHYVAAPADDDQ